MSVPYVLVVFDLWGRYRDWESCVYENGPLDAGNVSLFMQELW